jgi:hypothetical protein
MISIFQKIVKFWKFLRLWEKLRQKLKQKAKEPFSVPLTFIKRIFKPNCMNGQEIKLFSHGSLIGFPRSLTFLMFSPKLKNRKSTFGQIGVSENNFAVKFSKFLRKIRLSDWLKKSFLKSRFKGSQMCALIH